MSEQNNPNRGNTAGNKKGNIADLLDEGWHGARIANYLGVSRKTISKHIQILLDKGEIELLHGGNPKKYRKTVVTIPLKVRNLPARKGGEEDNWQPHEFGAYFAQDKAPKNRDIRGKITKVNRVRTIQIGKHVTTIWLHSGFVGSNRKELIEYGRKRILEIAQEITNEYGIRLTLLRWNVGIHWVNQSEEESKQISKVMEIEKGKTDILAGAAYTYEQAGWSDPNSLEIHPSKGFDKGMPTTHKGIWEWYLFNFPNIAQYIAGMGEYNKNIKLHTKVMQDIRDAIIEMKNLKKDLKTHKQE